MQYSQEGNKFNTMPIQPHDQGLLIKMVFYSIHAMYYHKNSIIWSVKIHLTVFKLILIVTYLKSHLFWGGGGCFGYVLYCFAFFVCLITISLWGKVLFERPKLKENMYNHTVLQSSIANSHGCRLHKKKYQKLTSHWVTGFGISPDHVLYKY